MAVAKHPRLELTGTAPNFKLRLTKTDGTALMESVDVYADELLAQEAVRALEDALLEAIPQPAPFPLPVV